MKAALITAALSLALLGATGTVEARSHTPHGAKASSGHVVKTQTAGKPAKKAGKKHHAKKGKKAAKKPAA